MKLLSPSEAQSGIKKRAEAQVEEIAQINRIRKQAEAKLANVKEDYTSDKAQKLREFEDYCRDLDRKKAVKLRELNAVKAEVEKQKTLYYGLVEKQDALIEREYQVGEREKKADLRERFLSELERKQWTATALKTPTST